MLRRVRPLVVSVVVALVALPAVASAQTGELRDRLTETRDERERIEEDLEEVRGAEGDARTHLATVDAELSEALAELAALEDGLAEAQERLAEAERRSLDARAQLLEATESLEATEAELADKRARLEARVVAAFKYGQITFAEAFVGTHDIADFLNSSTYLAHVLDADRLLVEDVSTLLGDVEQQRADAQALRVASERAVEEAAAAAAEVEHAVEEQQRLTALVSERRAQRQAALEALRDDRASIEGHLAGLERESGRIQSQLEEIARQQRAAEEAARREAEEAARRAAEEAAALAASCEAAPAEAPDDPEVPESPESADEAPDDLESANEADEGCEVATEPPAASTPAPGGWVRPVGGAVTSPFGPRWGRNHNGVDLAGGIGVGVVAARAGTVVHVTNHCDPISSWGCGGGFGNYVTVVHEAGMATVYAHLSGVAVGSGQQVGAGQAIGQVGNSGNSYGSHLHFEVRDAGRPKDPCGYISC